MGFSWRWAGRTDVRFRNEGGGRERRRGSGQAEVRGHAGLRHRVALAARQLVPRVPRGRRGGAAPQAQGQEADPAPKTREEELEREVRRLEAQVAHLKNR